MEDANGRTKRGFIFLDTPNLVKSAKQFGYNPDRAFCKLLDSVSQHGEIYGGYAYGDFNINRVSPYMREAFFANRIRFIHCPSRFNGQNKLDDPMLVEGVHRILRKDNNFFYALACSDIMILPISFTLRELRRDFRIFGLRQSSSSLLQRQPEFIDLEQSLQAEQVNACV